MSFVGGGGTVLHASTPRAVDVPSKQTYAGDFGILRCPGALTQKQASIMYHIMPHLTDSFLRDTVVPIIEQKSTLSLRALDWTVTNFSKKFRIIIRHNNDIIDIHEAYKAALSHYRRRNFDPFRRRTRLYFSVDDKQYETTCGQLCFLVWAMRMGVCNFATTHADAIEKDMCETSARCKREKMNCFERKRRKELNKAAHVRCLIQKTHTRHFDTTARVAQTDGC